MATVTSPLEQLNASTTKSIYSDLSTGEIRLITLLPGLQSTPLKCDLSVILHHTSARPAYEALSYVWGTQQNPATLTLNNHLLYITRNLEAALMGLRYSSSPRTLWIDALCINQTSIPERNAQVQVMHEIYRNAACVLLWLGSAAGASEPAMRFIQETSMGGFATAVDEIDDEGLISVTDAMRSLCLREYWERLWIVQEIAQAKTAVLVCGKYEIEWGTIMEAITLSFSAIWTERLSDALAVKGKEAELGFLDGFFHDRGPQSVVPPTMDKTGYRFQDEKKVTLTLAVMTASKKCVDPRDKIFGIYSLLPWGIKDHVKVDYSIETADVFLTAARAFIDGGACLDIISWPTRPQNSWSNIEDQLQLPSWVPNWSIPLDVIPYAIWHDHYGLKPDPRTTFVSYQFQDDNILNIKGCVVGNISSTLVCPVLQAQADSPATEAELNELWIYFIKCWILAENDEHDGDVKFLDCLGVQYKLEPAHFRAWIASFWSVDDFPKSSDFKLPLEELTWLGRGRQVHTYRMFFTFDWLKDKLSNGSRGWGMTSTSAQEGDLICVLPGCLLPVVLRAVGDNRHVIVSDAYTDDTLVTNVLQGFRDGYLMQDNFYIC